VFAKGWGDASTRKELLGGHLQGNKHQRAGIPQAHQAGGRAGDLVPRHAPHLATLLLMAGEPIHVVAQRLGHSDVGITWNTYSHVLPNQQKPAASRLAALLHG
jgi:integrase